MPLVLDVMLLDSGDTELLKQLRDDIPDLPVSTVLQCARRYAGPSSVWTLGADGY